jgi:hypothetical protein
MHVLAPTSMLTLLPCRPASLWAPSTGNISHKQYLEVNELAMRCVLALDGVSVRVPELRAVRKRLTARALSLQDQVGPCLPQSAPPDMGLH